MDDQAQRGKNILANISALKANKCSEQTVKSALGIHFLLQVGRLAQDRSLDKVKTAEMESAKSIDPKHSES